MKKTIQVLLGTVLLTAIASGQEEDAAPQGVPMLKLEQLVLEHFRPEKANASELYHLAYSLIGRKFLVEERGGLFSEPIENLAMLGDQLVLYDQASYVSRLKDTLAKLDRSSTRRESGVDLATETFVPSYISLESASEALYPFRRSHGPGVNNVTEVVQQRAIVLHDSPARIAEMRGVLEQLDRPEAQVRLTCYVLRGRRGGDSSPNVPLTLTENLGKLLPGMTFENAGFALLQTGVSSKRVVQVYIDAGTAQYELSFTPVAHDPESGSLTVQGCRVTQSGGIGLLSTDTVFRGGEYTVLGGTGQEPVFFVVHVTPVSWEGTR